MLCEGDLVAVPVPLHGHGQGVGPPQDGTDLSQGPGGGNGGGGDKDITVPSREEFALELVHMALSMDGGGGGSSGGPTGSPALSELVFFIVTRLVPEHVDTSLVVAGAGGGSGSYQESMVSSQQQPRYGAMVVSRTDSTLMQSGALHSAVPDPSICHAFQCSSIALVAGGCQALSSPLAAPPSRPPLDDEALSSLVKLLGPLARAGEVGPAQRLLCRSAVLLHGPPGSGKQSLVRAAAQKIGFHVREVPLRSLLHPSDVGVTSSFRAVWDHAKEVAPCVLHITNLTAAYNPSSRRHGGGDPDMEGRVAAALSLCLDQVGGESWSSSSSSSSSSGSSLSSRGGPYHHHYRGAAAPPVIVVGSCEAIDDLAEPIRRCFHHEVKLGLPPETLRAELLRYWAGPTCLSPHVDISAVARRTAGRSAAELRALLIKAGQVALSRSMSRHTGSFLACWREKAEDGGDGGGGTEESKGGDGGSSSSIIMTGTSCQVTEEDIAKAEKALTACLPAVVNAPKIPNVRWEDIGGLSEVKAEIMDMIELPLKHPEIFATAVKRRAGILVYGPPGTGKTLLAKAVATECGLTFLSVKGPELLDMYIGESEKNVRAVFAQVRHVSFQATSIALVG